MGNIHLPDANSKYQPEPEPVMILATLIVVALIVASALVKAAAGTRNAYAGSMYARR